jgi:Methyltransferase domain
MRLWRKRRVPLSERLFRRFMYKYYARYLLVDLQLMAKQETLDYIRSRMRGAMLFNDRWDLLAFALSRAPENGLVLEFGVEDGRSVNHLAKRTSRTVHGFDSFEGLPEDWSGTFEKKGSFTRKGQLPQVESNVKLHAGWFDSTLPTFLQANEGPAAFIHIDCDIYSSTRTVFELLAGRIEPGTVIVFDEYFNYPNWQEHEFKAFQEFVTGSRLRYEYAGFAIKNGHVMVRIV